MEKLSADMGDVELAKQLISHIAGHCWRGKGDMFERVHSEVSKRYPNWSRRRVRAIWHAEAAGIRYYEMAELAATAQALQEIADARSEHAAFVAQTAALGRALERQDADFHCRNVPINGRVSR